MLYEMLSTKGPNLVGFHSFGSSSVGPQFSTPSTLAAQYIRRLLAFFGQSSFIKCPKVRAIVERVYVLSLEFSGGPHTCRFRLLWSIFEALLALSRSPIFLVIDALDECTYDAQCDCDALTFLSSVRKTMSSLPRTKIVVFSRPLPLLREIGATTNTIFLHSQTSHHDQTLFFNAEYRKLALDPALQAAVRDKAESLCRGSFLWIKLYLAVLDRSSTLTDFNRSVNECPPEIWDLYSEMTRSTITGLKKAQLACRRSILLILCGVRVSLTLQEMKILLSLRGDPVRAIFSLCGHLVLCHGDHLQFMHPTVKEFLMEPSRRSYKQKTSSDSFSKEESHHLLALRCLKSLMDEQYGTKGRIGQRLRHNFGRLAVLEDAVATPDAMPYKYAAEYWDYHLTQVASPDVKLLRLANEFLHTYQFIFWSEFSYETAGNVDGLEGAYQIISKTLLSLKAWHSTLSDDRKRELILTDYFITPYETIAKDYAGSADEDKVLPWLPMLRLTGFFWLKADMDKFSEVAQRTRDGLVTTLGAIHPLTLLSRGNLGMAHTYLRKLPEAMAEYTEVVEAERDVLGTDDPRFYETMSLKSRVECLMGDYNAAIKTSDEACEGLLRLLGETSNLYLSARYWTGCALECSGRLEEALKVYKDIYTKREAQYGPRDPVVMAGRVASGNVLRKMSAWDESIKHLEDGLVWFRATIPGEITGNVFLMDMALNLLILYHDANHADKLSKLLDELGDGNGEPKGLERDCQLTHIRALALCDSGKVNSAITLLQGFFVALDRESYNRAVLWLLLDLADMLRARGDPGDADQARVNFEHILQYHQHDASLEDGQDKDEPDPPALLDLAERALRLVRGFEFDKADTLLKSAGAEWYRPADLWIWLGSPAADTTQMRAPALVVRDARASTPPLQQASRGSRGKSRQQWSISSLPTAIGNLMSIYRA